MQRHSKHIPTLDGWRALAILGLLAAHGSMVFFGQKQYFSDNPIRYGSIGVDFFFCLSGLLITKLLLEEADCYGQISLRAFYIRRAFRILPMALAYIAVCAVLNLIRGPWDLASSLLAFRNYLPVNDGSAYSAHLWTLSIEQQFYLLWPLFLVIAGLKRGARAAMLLAVLVGIWRMADLHWGLMARVFPDLPIASRTDLRADSILWGCAMAFALHNPAIQQWIHKRCSIGVWLLMIVALVCSVDQKPPLALMFVAAIIPVLLAGTMLHPEWLASRILETPLLAWIGRISFSLYLWQQIFLAAAWEPSLPFGILQQWPVNLAATVVFAVTTYYVIERPLIRIGHELADRTRQARPPVRASVAEASA